MSPGKVFDKEELNIKVLKCLDKSWQSKVTTILESKDLSTLTTTSLYNKLKEHELEINQLNKQESNHKKVKSITLRNDIKKKGKLVRMNMMNVVIQKH